MPPDLATALRERGQRVTSQRLVIHEELVRLGRHATAEQVMAAVGPRLPGLSLPTVYATLELLEELGFARRVAGVDGAALYDPRTDPHHHLVCRECGAAEDIDLPLDLGTAEARARARGFEPRHSEVTVSGLCSRCASLAAAARG